MNDLTEFLLVRIAEDDHEAVKAGSFTPWTDTFRRDNYGNLTIQPSRIEAECEAKRKIVELHTLVDPCDAHDASMETITCDTLRYLALIYANHPDYRDEWRP